MLEFYHCPRTRSTGVRILLEELGAHYEMRVLDRQAGENRAPAYLAINPMGKVPAIVHDGAVVTEQVAIYIYLADLFPAAGLAPAIGDPAARPVSALAGLLRRRLRACAGRQASRARPWRDRNVPYGDYDAVISALAAQLAPGPYLLGDRFTAADILWGTALGWTTMFKLIPERPEFTAYMQRVLGRPSVAKVNEEDAALAASVQPPA